jgi:hypothetical protein
MEDCAVVVEVGKKVDLDYVGPSVEKSNNKSNEVILVGSVRLDQEGVV